MTKKKIQKEKYIRLRKGKKSNSYQIDIPYSFGNETFHFVQTLNTADFEYDDDATLLAARMIRDKKLQEINLGRMKGKTPPVAWFYEKSWEFIPRSLKTRERHDTIFNRAFSEQKNIPLSKITVADIQKMVNLYAETKSQGEVNRLMAIWRDVYKTARLIGYDVQNLSDMIIKPKSKIVVKKQSQITTNAEIEDFLIHVLEYPSTKKNRWINLATYYVLSIMYYTGCRPAEVLSLTRSDIHDDYISINKSLGSSAKKKDVIVPTKTEGSTRNVPVSSQLRNVLDELLLWTEKENLFERPDGTLYNTPTFSCLVNKIAKTNGVDFHAYMLRHLLSTDLVRNQNARLAKDIMGHSNAGMTISYARTSADEMRQAIEGRTFAENMPNPVRRVQHCTDFMKLYLVRKFALSLDLIRYAKRNSDDR